MLPGSSSTSLSSWTLYLFLLYVFWHLQFALVHALYFASYSAAVTLPKNFSLHTPFFEAYVIRSALDPVNASITFYLKNRTVFMRNSSSINNSSVSLHSVDGNSQGVQLRLLTGLQRNFTVEICAKHEKISQKFPSRCLTLKIRQHKKKENCNMSHVCFGNPANLHNTIIEKSDPQAIARLAQPAYTRICSPVSPMYTISSINENNTIDFLSVKDGILFLNRKLERAHYSEFNITCSVLHKGIFYSPSMTGSLRVKIIKTRPPEKSQGTLKVDIENFWDTEQLIAELQGLVLLAVDYDNDCSEYQVDILDDPEKFFSVSYTIDQAAEYCKLIAKLHPRNPFHHNEEKYTFHVRFMDLALREPNVSNEVNYTIYLVQKFLENPILHDAKLTEFNHTDVQDEAIDVSRSAAFGSRILQPLKGRRGYTFFLETQDLEKNFPLPFGVTPQQGILYVNDTQKLQQINGSSSSSEPDLSFKLCWKNTSDFFECITINVTVNHEDENITVILPSECKMCALHDSEDACLKNSGIGAVNGHCHWFSQKNGSSYNTCISDFSTCPDKECDELERKFASICPQDCILKENIIGFHLHSSDDDDSPIGLQHAYGTCTCHCNEKCICVTKKLDDEEIKRNKTWNRIQNTTAFQHVPTVKGGPSGDECGIKCILVIIGCLFLVALLICAIGFMICSRKPQKLHTGRHKYPGSLASLPAIPSDYVDERSSSIASQNVNATEQLISISNKFMPVDSKWEFSRTNLTLEQTLGEGEFGRVMKAKALEINSQPGYTTVAVKMLKGNGSNTEEDLLAEFNLLKEVYHPNVIRLLGACSSKDGPLYIIVEYAEYGSLRSYLRKSRRLEFKSCTSDDSGVDSLANGGQDDHPLSEYQVNSRDVLSFGWQITKGMAYLSDMKLVHRDLAARNILIAAGKVVKISDFGLTRDVYEGDAYLKKSTGRVPVKWMAIESLMDHVYTTKSDVWSFGIVIWEIVTLGAAPYPGVLPEQLFHLLKNGYRMEKPDNCSFELYDIMRRCWQEHSHDRPHFSELTKVFENMLQANVEYLDLGMNMVHNMTYFDDTPALTDTIGEEIEEGDESEMGYGSLNVLPTDDSEYLQSNARCNEDDEDAFLLTEPSYELVTSTRNVSLPLEENTV